MSVVGPNWKPHVYTDRELDRIERRGNGTLEDFAAVLCRAIEKMSDEEKFVLRCGIRKAFKMATSKVGDTVTVELFPGHKIHGVVKAVYDSVAGKKFRVVSGDLILNVGIEQIVK